MTDEEERLAMDAERLAVIRNELSGEGGVENAYDVEFLLRLLDQERQAREAAERDYYHRFGNLDEVAKSRNEWKATAEKLTALAEKRLTDLVKAANQFTGVCNERDEARAALAMAEAKLIVLSEPQKALERADAVGWRRHRSDEPQTSRLREERDALAGCIKAYNEQAVRDQRMRQEIERLRCVLARCVEVMEGHDDAKNFSCGVCFPITIDSARAALRELMGAT